VRWGHLQPFVGLLLTWAPGLQRLVTHHSSQATLPAITPAVLMNDRLKERHFRRDL
jgi:hypothetical protein